MKKEIECYDLSYINVEKQTKLVSLIPPQFERHLRDSEETCSK